MKLTRECLMKSKELEVKSAKLSKTAKAALPLFALFGGGNGFASSRNPLSLQSSKKLAGKSVVYINETQALELPELAVNITQQTKSPFAVFTNQAVAQTKSVASHQESKVLEFLNNNDLLSSDKIFSSKISGNIFKRKSFSHVWTFSSPGSPSVTQACADPAYNSFFSYTSSGILDGCILFDSNSSYVPTTTTSSAANCRQQHALCEGNSHPVPVELLKFEID